MTFTSLRQAIIDYTAVDEPTFVSYIPTFIQNTEILIYNLAQLPALRSTATIQTVANTPTVALPSGFLAMLSIAVVDAAGNRQHMLEKDVNYIREVFPNPGVAAIPRFYALQAPTTLLLGPTPNIIYNLETHFFSRPASIVTAETTWLSTNFPMALLWGSLVEAYTYLKGETQMIAIFKSRFDEVIPLIKNLGEARNTRDDFRGGQLRRSQQ